VPITAAQVLEYLALAGAAWALLRLGLAWVTNRWPTVEGTVITSFIEADEDSQRTETAQVVYEYEVRGQVYQSSTIRPGGSVSWSTSVPGVSSAAKTVRDYRQGARVTVRYCSWWPSRACLEPGRYGFPLVLLVVCIALAAFLHRHREDESLQLFSMSPASSAVSSRLSAWLACPERITPAGCNLSMDQDTPPIT
jgi:hypothetical protein